VFEEFAKWTAERHDTYRLGITPAEVRQTFFRLAKQFDTHPVPGMDGTTFRWMTFGFLYSPHTFPALAETWQALSTGQRPPSAERAAQHPADVPADNFYAALNAITCADMQWSDSLGEHQRNVRIYGKRYPLFGAMMANAYACVGWAAKPLEPAIELTAEGPSNILLLHNLKDPANLHEGAVNMNALLGDRSRLVTVDEVGHWVYIHDDNTCASRITTDFLLGGQLPTSDQYCAREAT
jgi:hypothetical protein